MANRTTPTETSIDGLTYTVTRIGEGATLPNLHKHLLAKGFDGESYMLTGKRGAVKSAYRTAAGDFVIVGSCRA